MAGIVAGARLPMPGNTNVPPPVLDSPAMTSEAPRGTVGEVTRYFLRLGIIAFGGPAAHVAIMRRELVRERGWIDDDEFIDLLGATNLIPGPNSTEMTMHLGATRAGPAGLWAGGAAFRAAALRCRRRMYSTAAANNKAHTTSSTTARVRDTPASVVARSAASAT